MEYRAKEGDSPVKAEAAIQKSLFPESHCLRVQCKVAGEYLLKLNIRRSPIAHKYREGKLQRTLKRELKEPEIGNAEGFGASPPLRILLSGSARRVPLNGSFAVVGVRNVGSGGNTFACKTELVLAARAGFRKGGFGILTGSEVRNSISSG